MLMASTGVESGKWTGPADKAPVASRPTLSERHDMTHQCPKSIGLYEPRREHDACGIGAVVHIDGRRDRRILELGRQVLVNLSHRGAAGADESTGDGAGILLQIPHHLLTEELAARNITLPESGRYAVGNIFLPRDQAVARRCEALLEEAVTHVGLRTIAWRDVPADSSCLGQIARSAEPLTRQLFIDAAASTDDELECKLYLARRRAERLVREELSDSAQDFYVCSLSARTMVYKGMFMAHQLFAYYRDLADERATSALAIVHQRYSTNTFPNWRLAQPFRMVAHNGEINTLSGNANRMRAREKTLACEALGDDLSDVLPVLSPDGSDSAMFDNALELLVRAGRSLPHAMMMMVPEAFGPMYHISTDKRAFYEFHASIMEPWDGPAAMVFTDGKLVGGTLDRNGLRPARYTVTNDDMVILASETGVVDVPPEQVRTKGRLQPGRMFLVDTVEGRVITDNEIKSRIARQKPYRRWLEQNRIELRGLFAAPGRDMPEPQQLFQRLRSFGYTREELTAVLAPMATDAQEPVGSMGNDTPLAVLSDRPVSLFNYFQQMFAQVTNPPIDPLREGLVMSLMSFTGRQRNLLEESPLHARQLKLTHPVLTNDDMDRLRSAHRDDFHVVTVEALFDVEGDAEANLAAALDRLVADAAAAIGEGASLIIVSDRQSDVRRAAIPALLATSALHHGLLDRGLRGEAGIVVESGEPREVMHFCLLCGYGANAVNPYLAFDALSELRRRGDISADIEPDEMVDHYITAIKKGILKTMSKMGISTLRSYHGAQLFEAIGLGRGVVDRYFAGTSSRIGGISLGELAQETVRRHCQAYQPRRPGELELEFGGEYQYRRDGENHLWNPTTISRLQHAVMFDDYSAFEDYSRAVDDQSRRLGTLRGLLEFGAAEPVSLSEVEDERSIVRRFCTGAMSHGSISKEAHEALAVAMNRLGGMSNTGEGGEDAVRYQPLPNGDSSSCAIKQVASGRFGVTIHYLGQGREIQIKMAQGAKPGEGGQLPGQKVTAEIAKLRHSTPGVTLISPPPHHDIYSIEDLAQLIYDLKCANPRAKVSVKLVSEVGVGTIAAGVAKGNADEVLISGHDGGTGASPLSSIKHAGAPWELGLAETQQVLVLNKLRDRIRVQTDGQLRTGRDVVVAALLGAEQFGFGTAALISLGCVMMRKCQKGTCPVGVATQDPELRKRFGGKAEYVERFMLFVARQVRQIMAELGFRTIDEMVGRVDRLATRKAIDHYKSRGLDFSALLRAPESLEGLRRSRDQKITIEEHLDWKILEKVRDAIETRTAVEMEMAIRNVDRAIGTILSHHLVKRHGPEGLAKNTINLTFRGSAGQSFGAFLAPGITLRLIGDANDYVGKGLSGGKIIVQTPPDARFESRDNIIVGNTLLYGATSGAVFINGLAGERFAVRNSGAVAVVEGVGDHGCEYMTGGRVVVLGSTGRNFAAGMSGGTAYVLDEHQLFDTLCNLEMVDLENVYRPGDKDFLRQIIERHWELTGSGQARRILDGWREMVGKFVKVMPIDYRKALERLREREQRGGDYTPATEEVFDA
jgi:glutamate synthase domain-containing protein 2/glutamate synthase domain-containing protein 1/glutamate synthase domain-containing protein 3